MLYRVRHAIAAERGPEWPDDDLRPLTERGIARFTKAVERFWTRRGFSRDPLTIRWSFESRDDLAAVLRIEFPPGVADACLREHSGLEVDYAVNLWWRCP